MKQWNCYQESLWECWSVSGWEQQAQANTETHGLGPGTGAPPTSQNPRLPWQCTVSRYWANRMLSVSSLCTVSQSAFFNHRQTVVMVLQSAQQLITWSSVQSRLSQCWYSSELGVLFARILMDKVAVCPSVHAQILSKGQNQSFCARNQAPTHTQELVWHTHIDCVRQWASTCPSHGPKLTVL